LTPGIFQTHPASRGFCPETSHPSGDMAKWVSLLLSTVSKPIAGWWFQTWLLIFHILGIIIPIDFHIFSEG
jgi:hypothetical protein